MAYKEEYALTMTMNLKYKDKTKGHGYCIKDKDGKEWTIIIHGEKVIITDDPEALR